MAPPQQNLILARLSRDDQALLLPNLDLPICRCARSWNAPTYAHDLEAPSASWD